MDLKDKMKATKAKMKAKAVKAALSMLPPDIFDNTTEDIEAFISQMLSTVEVKEGERAAVIIIEGVTGYMVNIIRLDSELKMTIVQQMTLNEFFDKVENVAKSLKSLGLTKGDTIVVDLLEDLFLIIKKF